MVGHGFESPSMLVNTSCDEKGWDTMVLPRGQQVNLRNPLHAGQKADKQEIHPEFETQKMINSLT